MEVHQKLIERWKKTYGSVLKVELLGITYYFRPLMVGEFRKVTNIEDMEEKENMILRCGILYPHVNDNTPSGIIEKLSELISKATNITEETVMEKIQQQRDFLGMSDDFLKFKVQIIKNLNYRPEEVDKMTIDQFVAAIALTEEVIGRPLIAAGADDGTEAGNENEDLGEMEPTSVADHAATKLRAIHEKAKRRKIGASYRQPVHFRSGRT